MAGQPGWVLSKARRPGLTFGALGKSKALKEGGIQTVRRVLARREPDEGPGRHPTQWGQEALSPAHASHVGTGSSALYSLLRSWGGGQGQRQRGVPSQRGRYRVFLSPLPSAVPVHVPWCLCGLGTGCLESAPPTLQLGGTCPSLEVVGRRLSPHRQQPLPSARVGGSSPWTLTTVSSLSLQLPGLAGQPVFPHGLLTGPVPRAVQVGVGFTDSAPPRRPAPAPWPG